MPLAEGVDMDFSILRRLGLHETADILEHGGLVVHPAVDFLSLEGSRGPKGGYRPDSDLDLGLILRPDVRPTEDLCREVLTRALDNWRSRVELDAAVVFDRQGCGLKCFDQRTYRPGLCDGGLDCVGLYKIQRGFEGFVPACGVTVELLYPFVRLPVVDSSLQLPMDRRP